MSLHCQLLAWHAYCNPLSLWWLYVKTAEPSGLRREVTAGVPTARLQDGCSQTHGWCHNDSVNLNIQSTSPRLLPTVRAATVLRCTPLSLRLHLPLFVADATSAPTSSPSFSPSNSIQEGRALHHSVRPYLRLPFFFLRLFSAAAAGGRKKTEGEGEMDRLGDSDKRSNSRPNSSGVRGWGGGKGWGNHPSLSLPPCSLSG